MKNLEQQTCPVLWKKIFWNGWRFI